MGLLSGVAVVSGMAVALVTLPTIASATPPSLTAELLTVTALPSGWSVVPLKYAKGHDCVSRVEELVGRRPTAEIAFESPNVLPSVTEELHKGRGISLYAEAYRSLSTCRDAGKAGWDGEFSVHIRAMSLPRYGSQSAGFTLMGGGTATDLLLARRASVVVLVAETGPMTLKIQPFEGLAREAVSRLH